ncbi:unnamed protein product [Schistosoma rodhaini]|uniref:DIX domain-containing protein n=1 Tax=Schistosoma rodhaini TaxID=6188 RepID=A0AA85F517_9TREM|nr:unnamed protein product [Schistosoma rodhaini]
MNDCSMDELSTEDNITNNNNNLIKPPSNKSSSENSSSLFKHSELSKQDFLDHKMNTINQLFTTPLSDHNSTNTNISERQIETNQQNNQNISKLEDILSDISLSTFWEPFKTTERRSTEIKTPRIENMMFRKDDNSVVNVKLHPIFSEKSWAQSLFKESMNCYDEYKENPERILDDHFSRIWKTREACMLSEDQIDLQNTFQKYSKKCNKTRRKLRTNKNIYHEDQNYNNIDHDLKDFINNIELNGKDEPSYWGFNNSQYIDNYEEDVHSWSSNQKLTKKHFNSSKQLQVTNSHYSHDHNNYHTALQQNYYVCNICNKHYFEQNDYHDNLFNTINEEYIPVHRSEVITDYIDFHAFVDPRRKGNWNKRIINHSRRRSCHSCSDKSEEYNNRKDHHNFIQNSISLQDITNNKQDYLLNGFIISIVYVSEDSLPHVILCENIQWTLELFKRKVIQKLYSINQKLQNEIYNEFKNLRKRFYFKTESNELNTNMIYYEIIDDTEEIPRWKGLIWAKIEIDHNEVL